MKIQLNISEAQRLLNSDKIATALLNNTGLDACVTVEI
jgi:hypothetical protein